MQGSMSVTLFFNQYFVFFFVVQRIRIKEAVI